MTASPFSECLKCMRLRCDRVSCRKLDRTKFSIELLTFVARHLYMKVLRHIMDKHAEVVNRVEPERPVEGLDEAGSPPICMYIQFRVLLWFQLVIIPTEKRCC